MTSAAPALIVFYCAPFTACIVALDVPPEHIEGFNGIRERIARGGFSPRHLHLARPNLFRSATASEVRALRAAGCAPHYVHEWCAWDPSLATDVDPRTLLPFPSEVQS